jgi:hypothetical protein
VGSRGNKWRRADRPTLMSCSHNGVQKLIETGETYRTVVDRGEREVLYLCRQCARARQAGEEYWIFTDRT